MTLKTKKIYNVAIGKEVEPERDDSSDAVAAMATKRLGITNTHWFKLE